MSVEDISDRLLLAVDRVWPLLGVRAAEARGRRKNAEAKARGCRYCGRPATKVRQHHGTVGSVPFEWWTCDEHAQR